MTDQPLIIRDPSDLTHAFTQHALELKQDALSAAAMIGVVDDAATNQAAAEAHEKLVKFDRLIEKTRVEAKKPFLEAGKQIDAQAKELVAEVVNEQIRLTKLCGSFRQLEDAKRQAAEELARLEAEKIERERQQEILRIAREAAAAQAKIDAEAAEARRVVEAAANAARAKEDAARAQAAREAAEAKNAKEREAAAVRQAALAKQQAEAEAKRQAEAARMQIEIEKQRELSEAKTHEALDAAQEKANNAQSQVAQPPPAPIAAKGQSFVNDWEISVTDIWLLAKAHSTCVTIEPKISEIKALLKLGIKVAGVKAEPIVKVQQRGSSQPKAIDV